MKSSKSPLSGSLRYEAEKWTRMVLTAITDLPNVLSEIKFDESSEVLSIPFEEVVDLVGDMFGDANSDMIMNICDVFPDVFTINEVDGSLGRFILTVNLRSADMLEIW